MEKGERNGKWIGSRDGMVIAEGVMVEDGSNKDCEHGFASKWILKGRFQAGRVWNGA